MAIDARIALGVVPPKIDSPQEVQGTLARLAEMQGQAQERQMRVQAMQQEQADNKATRDALAGSNGSLRDAAKKLMPHNPVIAMKMLEQADSQEKSKIDHDLKVIDYTARLVGGPLSAPDPQTAQQAWTAMLGQMRQSGLSTDGLPEQFDPNVAKQLSDQALTAQQRLEARFKQIDDERMAEAARVAAADKEADNRRQDATAAETRRHNEATEGAAWARANRPVGTRAAAETGGLVDAVIANPSLWDDLTPTVKGQIAPALQAKGFNGFGKALPQAAITRIAESKSAIDSLNDLKTVLKENEQFLGPVRGLSALNPYSDARKAQARIDLVRQRVGKALEGGVLRKEDEEKYKKILANLTDVPSTAVSKIDGLIHTMDQDIKSFINEQRLSGRRVNTDADNRPGAKTQNIGRFQVEVSP